MRTSEEINEVAAALAEAQGVLKPAVKDSLNPAYRSKYADLAAVWESCREALPKLGLAVIQDVTNVDGAIAVSTRIMHKSGQWIECGPLEVPLAKADAHGLGSATSYGKRYALSAALGIVAEDDDDGNAAASGNRATAKGEEREQRAEAAFNAGLVGTAEKGTARDSDFELRQTPTGYRLGFRLVEGRKGIKSIATDALAELIAEYRAGIEGQRVTVWGEITDESFTNKDGKLITYQQLRLNRLKVGVLDLTAPEPEPDDETLNEELAQLAFPKAVSA